MTPKLLKDCSPPRLRERTTRMTMIGAMNCIDGVVLLSDGQETITDYAKWDVRKVKVAFLNESLRVVMTGAGDADTIDMIWEYVSKMWHGKGGSFLVGWVADVPQMSIAEWRTSIVAIVREVTEKTILPHGRCHGGVELIWLIQDLVPKPDSPYREIELFRTSGLNERNIPRYHFGGSPILLSRYLSDLYLDRFIWSTEDARALAAYLLWEAKDRDPNVGKQSDILIFKRDGTYSYVPYVEVAYWEDHFKVLKREFSFLPLLSCASSATRKMYDLGEYMERLYLTMNVLSEEQELMRQGQRSPGKIDYSLGPQIRRLVEEHAEKKKSLTRSNPETSEGQQ
jgi:hypothetical protein